MESDSKESLSIRLTASFTLKYFFQIIYPTTVIQMDMVAKDKISCIVMKYKCIPKFRTYSLVNTNLVIKRE